MRRRHTRRAAAAPSGTFVRGSRFARIPGFASTRRRLRRAHSARWRHLVRISLAVREANENRCDDARHRDRSPVSIEV